MHRKLFLFIAIGVMVALPAAFGGVDGTAASTAKPVRIQEFLATVPETLQEMFATSDEVLDVQILSSSARVVGSEKHPYVRTFYDAKVLSSRKGSTAKRVVFTQAAGEVEFPDYILRAADQPLTVGGRYVVFLRHNPTFGGRMLVGERSGAFQIAKGRIEPQGAGKIANEQRHLPEQKFRDELDRLSRRQQSGEEHQQ